LIETELGGQGRSKIPNPRRMKKGVLKKKEKRERVKRCWVWRFSWQQWRSGADPCWGYMWL